MGIDVDCVRMTLQPETQGHCQWGSKSWTLWNGLGKVQPEPTTTPGGSNFVSPPQDYKVPDTYSTPEPNFPLMTEIRQPSRSNVCLGSDHGRWGICIATLAIGPAIPNTHPVSSAWEQWENGPGPLVTTHAADKMVHGGGMFQTVIGTTRDGNLTTNPLVMSGMEPSVMQQAPFITLRVDF